MGRALRAVLAETEVDEASDGWDDGQALHGNGNGSHDGGHDLVGVYIHSVADIPLLSREEEVILAQRMEAGKRAQRRLQGGVHDPTLHQTLEAQIDSAREARDHFIKANTRLVISIAKRYQHRGVPLPDLIQEGNLGLMEAVERFDWRRGFKFSTYATWWIRQAVQRGLDRQSRTIRIPSHIHDRLRQLKQATDAAFKDLGREPTSRELGEQMEMVPEDVDWLRQLAEAPLSLNRPLDEDPQDGGTMVLFLADTSQPQPAERAGQAFLQKHLEAALTSLTAREARVLELRFGLRDGRPQTLEEVGAKFGLSRERIRQIERDALARLKRKEHLRLLRD